MSKNELVPAYYDGQNRATEPIFMKSREEIKEQRRAGLLHGSYQENGNVFVIYRAPTKVVSDVEVWMPRQSGYAGPLVLQMVN